MFEAFFSLHKAFPTESILQNEEAHAFTLVFLENLATVLKVEGEYVPLTEEAEGVLLEHFCNLLSVIGTENWLLYQNIFFVWFMTATRSAVAEHDNSPYQEVVDLINKIKTAQVTHQTSVEQS
jgi:hypothetical protein